MARPEPEILKTYELECGTVWDVLYSDSLFIITYQGRPCGIRQHKRLTHGYKYSKLSYTNLGNAEAQCRKMNARFNTTDFAVLEVA